MICASAPTLSGPCRAVTGLSEIIPQILKSPLSGPSVCSITRRLSLGATRGNSSIFFLEDIGLTTHPIRATSSAWPTKSSGWMESWTETSAPAKVALGLKLLFPSSLYASLLELRSSYSYTCRRFHHARLPREPYYSGPYDQPMDSGLGKQHLCI